MKLCICGCNNPVKFETNTYILGHNGRALKGRKLTEDHRKALVGRKPTKETLLKLRLAKLGTKHTPETLNKLSKAKKGRSLSKEHTENIRKALKGIKQPKISLTTQKSWQDPLIREKRLTGMSRKFYSWCAEVPFEVNKEYPTEFTTKLRNQIKQRDNFTCQECNKIESQLKYKLHVHHIDYNKKNNKPENLITLCKSCHCSKSDEDG